tara:strand:+ start:18781 stop:20001 length:1221 start_codon:yes stop_codon:yes gene_type:complete
VSADPQHVMSVGELTGHIKAVVEGTFPSMWVSGELSGIAQPRSGHVYFTLKDDDSQIRGVMWRGVASKLDFEVEDGQEVLCFGDIEVYAPRGTYQLVVRKMQPQGVGALQLALQQLQQKLSGEGLFAAERKRELPTYPRRIGIITSPSSAAVRDFLQAATNRFQGVEIVVIPAVVQGQGAAKSIVDALKAAHRITPLLDVVILSRGGGSLEDLWCFNEEPVVRAVAASNIPTVSAVGHEIDVTLCDLAADVRALTPTDAATRVLPDGDAVRDMVEMLTRRIQRTMSSAIDLRRQRLESIQSRQCMRKPMELIHLRSRRLDELDDRARRAIRSRWRLGETKVQSLSASLSALSPLSVLARGYSFTLDTDGNPIRSAADVSEGDLIRSRLAVGEIESRVVRKDQSTDA